MIDRKLLKEMSLRIVTDFPGRKGSEFFDKCARSDLARQTLGIIGKGATEEERRWFMKLCKAS